jgi:hypothetical protein
MNVTSFPNCCGASVIINFSEIDETARNRLIELVHGEDGKKYNNHALFIILNDSQATSSPKLLATMSALGFVYVGRSNNKLHDSWINTFMRIDIGRAKYKEAPFKYPGIDRADWTVEASQLPPLKRIDIPKKAVPDPFAKANAPTYRYDIEVA